LLALHGWKKIGIQSLALPCQVMPGKEPSQQSHHAASLAKPARHKAPRPSLPGQASQGSRPAKAKRKASRAEERTGKTSRTSLPG